MHAYKRDNSLIREWTEVICDSASDNDQVDFGKNFIEHLAAFFYSQIQRTQHLFSSPFDFSKEFSGLSEKEKSVWYGFTDRIPSKLNSINLRIRPFKDFCRTCLIPYEDLEKLAISDYNLHCRENRKGNDISYRELPEDKKRFYIELNHLIPSGLREAGFEIIRAEEVAEIDEILVYKMARAIHSRYLYQLRKQEQQPEKNVYMEWIHKHGGSEDQESDDFDTLPKDIRRSNLDNAYHIPAKLLSIGYRIRPVRKGYNTLVLHLTEQEVENMARVEHIRWCWDKILGGWYYGKIRDDIRKLHPSIVPYEELPESEKEKDRELVRLIPALLQDIGYEAFPVNPDKISRLPYAIKPLSSIHRILGETQELNDEVRNMTSRTGIIEETMAKRNRKISEAIREIEGSYNYARHIQNAFLPDSLYIRECFPDSFVLFKPKDIVSGDFYFFNRSDHKAVFAAADCTGHGIPGAMLSTIGYGILDQAVNELRITEPTEILAHLYSRMHRFLGKGTHLTGVEDDMDIALCSVDLNTNRLVYAGVGNPLYHFSCSNFIEYKPGNIIEYSGSYNYEFTSESLNLMHGDVIYLCTDGYADQFGGSNHRKYQSGRLKETLMRISDYPMHEQGDILYEEIERWRGEKDEEQTDDILVIGIRI